LKHKRMHFTTLVDLKNHEPKHKFFVGLDSDGTVFDSMEVKHKDCYAGSLIRVFGLAAITHEIHEVWNFVNIYSNTRGTNRFKALILTFDYLRAFERIHSLKIELPNLKSLRKWVETSTSLSNDSLKQLIMEIPEKERKEIEGVLEWSEEVNRVVGATVFNLPPMEGALKAMDLLKDRVDLMVISNTPLDALQRDWQENNIVSNILYIGGQETGSKTEMLMAAANGKYRSDHILIIGDSPGDLTAAQNINALFFPILPTKEEYSWESFLSEGARRFLANRYNVSYQKEQIEGFESVINTVPSWNK